MGRAPVTRRLDDARNVQEIPQAASKIAFGCSSNEVHVDGANFFAYRKRRKHTDRPRLYVASQTQ